MPQFDKITFFNQIFWLLFFFKVFYFISLKRFLPKIGTVLKLRSKKFTKGHSLSEFSDLEIAEIYDNSTRFFVAFSCLSRAYSIKTFLFYDSLLEAKQEEPNERIKIQNSYLTYFSQVYHKKFFF